LLKPILELWKLTTLDELVRHANASPPPDFSSLVPLVLDGAENPRPSGAWTGHPLDPVAQGVLRRAGGELAGLAGSVLRRLFGAQASVRVAMAGGVFRQSEVVRKVFYNTVVAEFPRATVQAQIVDAVDGALALARKVVR